jgi:hypothetical protein
MTKVRIVGETREDRFRRLAATRTNEVLRRLKILGNCANRQIYSYTEKDIDKIFSAIDRRLKEIRSRFHFERSDKFKL